MRVLRAIAGRLVPVLLGPALCQSRARGAIAARAAAAAQREQQSHQQREQAKARLLAQEDPAAKAMVERGRRDVERIMRPGLAKEQAQIDQKFKIAIPKR